MRQAPNAQSGRPALVAPDLCHKLFGEEYKFMGAIKAGVVSVPSIRVDTTQLRHFVFGPRPHRTLCRVLVWCVLTVTFFHHLLVPIQIIGSSMSPTYRNGSLNLVNRLSYTKKHPPKRGDVVALNAEGE